MVTDHKHHLQSNINLTASWDFMLALSAIQLNFIQLSFTMHSQSQPMKTLSIMRLFLDVLAHFHHFPSLLSIFNIWHSNHAAVVIHSSMKINLHRCETFLMNTVSAYAAYSSHCNITPVHPWRKALPTVCSANAAAALLFCQLSQLTWDLWFAGLKTSRRIWSDLDPNVFWCLVIHCCQFIRYRFMVTYYHCISISIPVSLCTVGCHTFPWDLFYVLCFYHRVWFALIMCTWQDIPV